MPGLSLLSTLVSGRGQAASPRTAEELPVGEGGEGLVVVVGDAGGQLGPAPLLRTGGASVALRDDGLPPDALAGDRVWTTLVPGVAGPAEVELALVGAAGQTLWEDELPLGPGLVRPVARIVLGEERVLVALSTHTEPGAGVVVPPEAPPAAEQVDLDERPPAPTPEAPPAPGGAFVPGAVVVQLAVGLLGLALGLWLGLRRGPAIHPDLEPVGRPPLPPAVHHAWRLPEALRRPVLLDLARGAPGPVLLVTRAAAVEVELPAGVVRLARPRPELDELRAAATLLARLGPVRVLVEGPEALAATAADAAPGAALEALATDLPDGVELIVLCAGEEAGPAVDLSSQGEELVGPEGAVLRREAEGWRRA